MKIKYIRNDILEAIKENINKLEKFCLVNDDKLKVSKCTKLRNSGISLEVHWLRHCLPMQRVQVPCLVGELRSHIPLGQKKQNIKQKR